MTTADLAWALGYKAVGTNEEQLQRCLDAADTECYAAVDPVEVVTPLGAGVEPMALYDSVVLQRAVEWWKANDAAFGALGYSETGGLRPPDGFERHYAALAPMKEQWGLA